MEPSHSSEQTPWRIAIDLVMDCFGGWVFE